MKSNAGKLLGANHQVRLQKAQQQIKEEAFQDGNFTQKAHQYLSSLTGRRINSCKIQYQVTNRHNGEKTCLRHCYPSQQWVINIIYQN